MFNNKNEKNKMEVKAIILIFLSLIIPLFVMADAYAILSKKLTIKGSIEIAEKSKNEEDKRKACLASLSFQKKESWNNTFVYIVTIQNNSHQKYQQWQLKMYDTGYVTFPNFSGEETADGWVLNNSNLNNVLEEESNIQIEITFDVKTNLENGSTPSEYAEYYVNHFIILSECDNATLNNLIQKSGNATLTIRQFEEEVTTFTLKENKNYNPLKEHEKQYVLTIQNLTNKDYLSLRFNLYFGSGSFIRISPNQKVTIHQENVTVETLDDFSILKNQSFSMKITLITPDELFVPDIVILALPRQE